MGIEERADEILGLELDEDAEVLLDRLLSETEHVTTVLQAIEQWLEEQDDARGARIVSQCAVRMATHEAETE